MSNDEVSLVNSVKRFLRGIRLFVHVAVLSFVLVLINPFLERAACSCPPGFANYSSECKVHGVDDDE